MAMGNILPFTSPHGSHSMVRNIRINSATSYSTAETSFKEGEVCILASGVIGAANAVIADGATVHAPATHFVSAVSSEGALQLYNLASAAASIFIHAPFYPVLGENEFITRNLYNNSDTRVVPVQADVGNICGWWRDNTAATNGPNGTFGIDQNGTGLIITRVLDARMNDIGQTLGNVHGATTGAFVVFKANGE